MPPARAQKVAELPLNAAWGNGDGWETLPWSRSQCQASAHLLTHPLAPGPAAFLPPPPLASHPAGNLGFTECDRLFPNYCAQRSPVFLTLTLGPTECSPPRWGPCSPPGRHLPVAPGLDRIQLPSTSAQPLSAPTPHCHSSSGSFQSLPHPSRPSADSSPPPGMALFILCILAH